MTIDTQPTRENWLNQAAAILINTALRADNVEGAQEPPVRVSVAPMTSKILGICHKRVQSDDGHNEIFITAHIDDSVKILDVLTHELIHAFDDGASGHRNYFARVARAAGLEGKLTATTAGPELTATLEGIVDILGPIPHAKLNLKPKSKGRNNNKIVCDSCGFQANLSRKWVDAVEHRAQETNDNAACPACAGGLLLIHTSD